ncbi:MAG: hypothetical protein U5P10_13445 [Spirochaetia bacterium]|nr:hypothetical protein [Spirochaetia bacterium]
MEHRRVADIDETGILEFGYKEAWAALKRLGFEKATELPQNLWGATSVRGSLCSIQNLPEGKAEKLITFIYYKDLKKGMDFYGNVLGFPLEIDQGWSKIYRISEAGYVGVVDEKPGNA